MQVLVYVIFQCFFCANIINDIKQSLGNSTIKYRKISLFTTLFLPLLIICIALPMKLTASEKSTSVVKQKPAQEVAVIIVSEQSELIRLLLGTVFSLQSQFLSSEVAGIVISKRLSMGSKISKGDIIAKLDAREAQAKLVLIKAELSIAKIGVQQKSLMLSRINLSGW